MASSFTHFQPKRQGCIKVASRQYLATPMNIALGVSPGQSTGAQDSTQLPFPCSGLVGAGSTRTNDVMMAR